MATSTGMLPKTKGCAAKLHHINVQPALDFFTLVRMPMGLNYEYKLTQLIQTAWI
jgi:hypothetical protein